MVMTAMHVQPLTTRRGLQNALDYTAGKPRRLAPAEMRALTPTELDAYDDARSVFFTREITSTPMVNDALRDLQFILAMNQGSFNGQRGLAISGKSFTGKTTICLAAARQVARKFERTNPNYREQSLAPVIWVEAPPDPSPKTMGRLFHHALDIPMSNNLTADLLAYQAQQQVDKRRTRLVVVDEVHHLTKRSTAAADVLKQFSNLMPAATFLYAGIDLPESGLLEGAAGQQVGARFQVFDTNVAYGPSSDEWKRIVKSLASNLVLSALNDTALVRLSPYLHKRCSGRIGHLADLLLKANIAAMKIHRDDTMQETISRELLDTIPLPYAAEGLRGAKATATRPRKRAAA